MTDFTEGAIEAAEAAIDEAQKSGHAAEGVETRLLTLYSFYPQRVKPDYVLKAAMFALMKLPETDFSACLPLIPDGQLTTEPLSVVVEADNLLVTAEFERFWTFIEPHKKTLEDAIPVHFFEAIRRYIICVISLTHLAISRALLARLLGFAESDPAFDDCIKAAKATVEGESIRFPPPTIIHKQNNPGTSDLSSPEQFKRIMNVLKHEK